MIDLSPKYSKDPSMQQTQMKTPSDAPGAVRDHVKTSPIKNDSPTSNSSTKPATLPTQPTTKNIKDSLIQDAPNLSTGQVKNASQGNLKKHQPAAQRTAPPSQSSQNFKSQLPLSAPEVSAPEEPRTKQAVVS